MGNGFVASDPPVNLPANLLLVREDYSHDGDAWSRKFICKQIHKTPMHWLTCSADFSHDQSRKRAYRWGEDGIAGVSDTHGLQNITFAFWNENEYVFGSS